MKRILVILACLVFASCASTKSTKGLTQFMPFAVVTVSSNAEITWDSDKPEGKGLFNQALDKALAKKDDEKLSTLLSRADALIDIADRSILATLTANSITVVPKEKLFPAEAYKTANESKLRTSDMILPAEYRYFDVWSKNFGDMAKETGAQGIAIISIRFNKTMSTGVGKTGSMGASVGIILQIINPKNGKLVFTGDYYGQSKQHIPVAAGVYDPRELAKLFPEAIDAACEKMAKNFEN